MKDEHDKYNQQLKAQEEALYEEYKADVRRSLIRNNAEDLIPMILGDVK